MTDNYLADNHKSAAIGFLTTLSAFAAIGCRPSPGSTDKVFPQSDGIAMLVAACPKVIPTGGTLKPSQAKEASMWVLIVVYQFLGGGGGASPYDPETRNIMMQEFSSEANCKAAAEILEKKKLQELYRVDVSTLCVPK